MKKLISIIGPTATGKTKLALQLSEVIDVEIISADSRQVYKGMEIGTGVDVPLNDPHIHGVSIIRPNEEWSVMHFQKMAREVMQQAWENNRLPVLVGGTGLYHRHLFNDQSDLHAKPNEEIRAKAALLSIKELQNWLQKLSAGKFTSMNESDQQNPRRLIRAIEILSAEKIAMPQPSFETPAQTIIGLTDSIENIQSRIKMRIEDRLQNGFFAEVQKLMSDYSDEDWKNPAFTATGYKEARMFLEDQISEKEFKTLWLRREVQYAKRQLTWWKKYGDAKWFNVSEPDWSQTALRCILE